MTRWFALLLCGFLVACPAHAGAISDWIRSGPTPATAIEQMGQFSHPDGPLSPDYRTRFAVWARQQIATTAQRRIDAGFAGCEPQAAVHFFDPGIVGSQAAQRQFEGSIFLVENIYCLDHGTAADAYRIYNSTEYRTQVMPLVDTFSLTADRLCLRSKAKAGLIKASAFCHDASQHLGPGFWGLVARLTDTEQDPSLGNVYFRETVVIFADRPDGGVVGFRGVMTRGRELGSIQRPILKTFIHSTQGMLHKGMIDRMPQVSN